MFEWAEISETTDDRRFHKLSKCLADVGIQNKFSFFHLPLENNLRDKINELSDQHKQLRIGGDWRDRVKDNIDTWPATLLTLRSADALVCENNIWWPRNFLSEGVQMAIADSALSLDLTGSVLILGASPETRAVVHALVRVGFTKFILSDLEENKMHALQAQLSQLYFNVQFRSVLTSAITQLPSASSVAVNTLVHEQHKAELAELVYLNFLTPGGCWLDLSLGSRGNALDEEGETVGAQVVDGWQVWARADLQWLYYVLPDQSELLIQMKFEELADAYRKSYLPPTV